MLAWKLTDGFHDKLVHEIWNMFARLTSGHLPMLKPALATRTTVMESWRSRRQTQVSRQGPEVFYCTLRDPLIPGVSP